MHESLCQRHIRQETIKNSLKQNVFALFHLMKETIQSRITYLDQTTQLLESFIQRKSFCCSKKGLKRGHGPFWLLVIRSCLVSKQLCVGWSCIYRHQALLRMALPGSWRCKGHGVVHSCHVWVHRCLPDLNAWIWNSDLSITMQNKREAWPLLSLVFRLIGGKIRRGKLHGLKLALESLSLLLLTFCLLFFAAIFPAPRKKVCCGKWDSRDCTQLLNGTNCLIDLYWQ